MNLIGNKLRKLRTDKRLSQQEVADILKIDRKTYANWEQNIVDVKGSLIPKLAEIFGVEISELFTQGSNFQISQSFKNSTINTAILILTDKESVNRVLDAVKFMNKEYSASSAE